MVILILNTKNSVQKRINNPKMLSSTVMIICGVFISITPFAKIF